MTEPKLITELLARWNDGDRGALDELVPAVYQELRGLARAHLAHERKGHTLQPTALVHEVFLRLPSCGQLSWQDRAHFYAIAARIMRQVLIDHARRRRAAKRRPPATQVTLSDLPGRAGAIDVDVIALNEALAHLATKDARQCEVVEMRYFAGLSHEEIAAVLGVSVPTVKRDWRVARLWLRRELAAGG